MNTEKQELRERITKLLRDQSKEDQEGKSAIIERKLFELPEFKQAKTILYYASFHGEVNTLKMIKNTQAQGKTICLPRLDGASKEIIPAVINDLETDLETGPFGIQQPKEEAETIDIGDIDMVAVPGVAFDQSNNRLGRGGGYYDRLLERLPKDTETIGLAFDFQIVDHLSFQETHDIPVSRVISN